MQFVQDARRALTIGYTAWAFYALAAVTLAPDVIYLAFAWDTNPFVWSVLQIVVIAGGIVGRVIQQTEEGAWRRRIWIFAAVLLFAFWAVPSLAMSVWPQPSEPVVEDSSGPPTYEETAAILTPHVSQWEGRRLTAYFDLVGVATICDGHTRTVTAADVHAGTTFSAAKCDALLSEELHEYWSETRKGFTPDTIAGRLTRHRDAAYASLSYNVGWGGVRKSTATRRLNAGDIAGGCEALTWWNKAGGRVVRGLVNRRNVEFDMCMMGVG
ncbi:lysozyme [uncultured Tateyamaria sp.]|uniref:lysozyme n=1 Tax=uncultured Tateyamaria sp. TaxID=455651 RepID=UPI00261099E0|nr:lysozyme [uncultured Tateyamaria sp.]